MNADQRARAYWRQKGYTIEQIFELEDQSTHADDEHDRRAERGE